MKIEPGVLVRKPPAGSNIMMLISNSSPGWALERAFSGGEGVKGRLRIRADEDNCVHHHANKSNFVGKGSGMLQPKPN